VNEQEEARKSERPQSLLQRSSNFSDDRLHEERGSETPDGLQKNGGSNMLL
jgi:hypothetical protein